MLERDQIKLLIQPQADGDEATSQAQQEGEAEKQGNSKGGKKKEGAQQEKQKKAEKITLKSVLTKIVPYASFPYADHALRKTGVTDPNAKAEPTDQHVDMLIAAAQALRTMVQEMESLEVIRGFITYAPEAEKRRPMQDKEEDEKNEPVLEKLQQEAQQ